MSGPKPNILVMPRPRCATPPPTEEQLNRDNQLKEGSAQPPPAPKKQRMW